MEKILNISMFIFGLMFCTLGVFSLFIDKQTVIDVAIYIGGFGFFITIIAVIYYFSQIGKPGGV